MRVYRLLSGFVALGCALVSFFVACTIGIISGIGGNADNVSDAVFYGPMLMILAGVVSVLMCWNKNFIVSICISVLFICAGIVELVAIRDFTQAWIFASIMILLGIGHIALLVKEKLANKGSSGESN